MRRLLFIDLLVVLGVLGLSVAWEFGVEAWVLPGLGLDMASETLGERLEYVLTSVTFALVALVVPTLILHRVERTRQQVSHELAAHRQRLEDEVAERTRELTQTNRALQSEMQQTRRAQEALALSESQHRAVNSAVHDALLLLDAHGRVVLTNPSAGQIFRGETDALLQRDVRDLLAPSALVMVAPRTRPFLEAPTPALSGQVVESEALRLDGTAFPVELTLAPLADGAGAVVALRDISDRKRSEAEQARLRGRLQRAEKLEAVGTFASGICHDFNNLLLAVSGFAETAAARAGTPAETVADLAELSRAAARGRQLVDQILQFSRDSESTGTAAVASQVLEEAVAQMRAAVPKRVDIQMQCRAPLETMVACDAVRFHQVITNLCSNAARAVQGRGGAVLITLEVEQLNGPLPDGQEIVPGAYVVLAVADDGPGMSQKTLARIFDPYFTTRATGVGTGLGLATVHGIVTRANGAICVASHQDRGTTMTVYLPCAQATAAEATPDPPAAFTQAAGARLLLVDDDPLILLVWRRMLQKLGHEVTACSDADEALALFAADPNAFDGVLSDVSMPGLSGADLRAGIHRLRPDTPVLMVTGMPEAQPPTSSAGRPSDGPVPKPATLAEFKGLVAALLGESRAPEVPRSGAGVA